MLYVGAYNQYTDENLISPTVQPFTKVEKMKNSKYKAPRMIQARKPIFNIMYGKYIKPLEIIVTKYHRLNNHFGKGTTNTIAEKISRLSQKWEWKTEGDHKTFDAHVTKEMLSLTHKYYKACFGTNHTDLNWLTKQTLRNSCRTRQGDKYKVTGTRMSGDVDTSFGNSLINLAILKELMEKLGVKGEAIVNGDDFILFTNKKIDIIKSKEILSTMNMETDMKDSTRNIHQVEFCANKLVLTSEGEYTLYKDIDRIFSKFGMTNAQVDLYRNYILECLHGNWKMMKTTPIGLVFKEIYYKTLELETKVNGKNILGIITDHKQYKYKYLERSLIHQIRESRKDKETSSKELTISMYMAYDETIELDTYRDKLYNKIKNIYIKCPNMSSTILAKLPYRQHVLINHNCKTTEILTD